MNATEMLTQLETISHRDEKEIFLSFFTDNEEVKEDAITTLMHLALETKKLFNNKTFKTEAHPFIPMFIFSEEEISLIHRFMMKLFLRGREQKYFRQDISAELAGRMFLKHLLDIQFPEKDFRNFFLSYETVYTLLIDDFISSLFSKEGKNFFKRLEKQTQPF